MEDVLIYKGFQQLLDGRQVVLDHAYVIYPEHTCVRHIFETSVVIVVD